MAITNAFREAVSSGNTRGVRIMMKDSLLVDPSFSEFEEMERVASGLSDLYDAHDGREFETDKSKWDDAYMNKLMVQVVSNFSHERISHLKEVVSTLHPAPAKRPAPTNPAPKSEPFRNSSGQQTQRKSYSTSYAKQRDEDMRNGRIIRVVGGAAIGAVVGGTIGAIAGAAGGTIAGAAIGGAVLGGAVTAAIPSERK